jgi:hypothetical protein
VERARTKKEREAAEAEAREYRHRVIDLPDPDDEMVRYLPSRSPEGEESGISQRRAEALCRRMVAVHCLYGVDKNPLAVELAKLALWLESHAEGMPLTFLDHRLVVGDSLTGPFWDKLIMRPSDPKEPVEGIFHQGLTLALQNKLAEALSIVRHLEAKVGITLAEIDEKERLKHELEQALRPFRIIAAAWSGGVMLGPEKCDDLAYGDLLKSVAETGEIPEQIESERLRAMIGRGLEVGDSPENRGDTYDLLSRPRCGPALPYDLAFPEVFYPTGAPHGRSGFDAVLGNPPWDTITIKRKEWFANFDFGVLAAATTGERQAVERRLLADERVASEFGDYVEEFEQNKRANDIYYRYQKIKIEGDLAGRFLDSFRVFMERNCQLLGPTGVTGVVIPSAFHANEGATGVRQLYLEKMQLHHCYSFENRRALFEIHRSFKFAVIIAKSTGPTKTFSCAYYLHDDEWLFGEDDAQRRLVFTSDFVRRTGGDYLTFPELRSKDDYIVCEQAYRSAETMQSYLRECSIRLAVELNMTKDAHRFKAQATNLEHDPRKPEVHRLLLKQGSLILVEGKTFWHFDDCWGEPPRYLVPVLALQDKPHFLSAARFYRFAFRDISSATNERTVVFSLLPPGVVFGDTAKAPERKPQDRPSCRALTVVGLSNTYVFDYLARLKAASHVSLFLLEGLPVAIGAPSFVAHLALRLSCNHSGYEPLWREQVGDAWREEGKELFTWPVLVGDAVVADAYGLSRDQYEHVLSTFSHASYPNAPELCLAKFDELKRVGLDAFTRKHDPYHDIPLNENLPQPVIDLPAPAEVGQERIDAASQPGLLLAAEEEAPFRLTSTPKPKRGRRKKP